MSEQLTGPLLKLLGEDAFVRLAEAFGGTRLSVPADPRANRELVDAIGLDKAELLSRRYAPDQLRVPLARELRAARYRAKEGLSNARIARRLGINETSVNKIFDRLNKRGQLPAKASQLVLDFRRTGT